MHPPFTVAFPSVFSIVIGSVSFAGSMVAFAKLQELMTGTPITYPGQQVVNGLLAAAIIGFVIAVLAIASVPFSFISLMVLALVLGVAFVLPIGGADMPVVISLLNAFTGLAVAASGFTLNNFALIVAGTLVGASGSLLTKMMSDAMGRSLGNVLFGAFGQVHGRRGRRGRQGGSQRAVRVRRRPRHAARLLAARDHRARATGWRSRRRSTRCASWPSCSRSGASRSSYAIHPVAGRMPGHMNVLLAEANVPYEQLKEMDEINDEFKNADVALIVGANDVVNPAARTSPGSPIYGMPILNADQAKNIVFMKRSMRPGFAGIDNELCTTRRR